MAGFVVVVGFVVVAGFVAAVVVVGVGGAVVVTDGVVAPAVGTEADFGVEEELPHPATASAVRTSRANRDRRRRTPQTVAQAPAVATAQALRRPASIERQSSSMGW